MAAADGAQASQASGDLIILAQNAAPAAPGAPGTAADFANRVKNVAQEEQLGWLSTIGRHFIGVFQQGGTVFTGFVTGIIPTLIVLMTAFYAITEIVGEQRVHGLARAAGRIALTRYTVLPVMAMFFLTNPMAYTFGTFLEEKHKPAFYDSAVSSLMQTRASTLSGAVFWWRCSSLNPLANCLPVGTSILPSGTSSSALS
jgi:PTS system glucitol/sorbitol-specific IIC component